MNTILGELGKSPKFVELTNKLENKKGPITISGLTDVGMIQQIVAINEFTKKPICIITYNEIQARRIVEDLKYFTEKTVLFPKKEIVTYDYVVESKELSYKRIEALNKIYSKKNLIVVTTIEAVMQNIAPKTTLYKDVLKFKVGNSYNLESLKGILINLGYLRCDMVETRGEFSIRGGILDIALTEKQGVRIEFWGDEIDSIRKFNISSQRSHEIIENITIYPATEFILESNVESVCKKIESKYKDVAEDIETITERKLCKQN